MIDTRTAPFAALLLRLALGVMFVSHGLQKLLIFTPAGTAQFFASVGFPGWLAGPVIAAETIVANPSISANRRTLSLAAVSSPA